MGFLFKQSAAIESEIDTMLDDITQAALLFHAGVKEYLAGESIAFSERLERVSTIESKVDQSRRDIRNKLYRKMLIPESRGDVLSLLENIDNVVDRTKEVLTEFDVEHPIFPQNLLSNLIKLSEASMNAMENTVLASRAFFKEVYLVQEFVNKTFFYEHEADTIEATIKKEIFSEASTLELAERIQLKRFVEHLASISDEAESVCERISVAAIKRTI